MGKALWEETPILTSNGWSTMGNLKVGDYVYDENGNETLIIDKTTRQLNRRCYEVEFMHGEKIIADAEHDWVIIDSNGKDRTITTEQMASLPPRKTSKSSLGVKIKKSSHIDFKSNTVLPINPYDFGIWLGDGFSRTNKMTIHIDDYYEYKNNINLTEKKFRKGSTTCVDTILLDVDKNKLKDMNQIKNKHIPESYLFTSLNNRLELLRGLMDSDGSVEKNGVCRFYQSNLSLITDVRLLLSTLGIKSTIRSKETGYKTAYTLAFVYNENDIFKLPRKLERQYNNLNHKKNYHFYIRSITEVDSVPVYCITVDNPTHLFLAGKTLIPTHNCVINETLITVRNKSNGEVMSLTIEEFHKLNKE